MLLEEDRLNRGSTTGSGFSALHERLKAFFFHPVLASFTAKWSTPVFRLPIEEVKFDCVIDYERTCL